MSELKYMDGRPYTPPKNPLIDKWSRLYPPTPNAQASQVCDGYSCIWCSRCPTGANWKVPEGDMADYTKWQEEMTKYHHENGSMLDVMIPFNQNSILE
jgi:hypothetical protein